MLRKVLNNFNYLFLATVQAQELLGQAVLFFRVIFVGVFWVDALVLVEQVFEVELVYLDSDFVHSF